MTKLAVLGIAAWVLWCGPARAASPLLFDSFEGYNRGTLDANSPSDTNTAPNGGPGNPWWGSFPPDLRVVAAETNLNSGISTNFVSPHSGTNMVRGKHSGAADFDRNFFNVTYRLNHGANYSGNVSLDWWFFDPVGAKTNSTAAPQYRDYASLGYWTGIPGNADYVASNLGQPDPGVVTAQLSIGASTTTNLGYKSTNYQAQIFPTSATNAYDQANGWFNLPVARTVGWHHARIVVSAVGTNHLAPVAFYVDDLVNAALTNNAPLTNGINCAVLQAENGNLTGYFDDVTFDAAALPILSIALAGNNTVVTWPVTNWTLQFSTSISPSGFTDISNATSPYTNSVVGPTRYFRLRQ